MTEDGITTVEIVALPENLKQLRTVIKDTLSAHGVESSVVDAVLLSIGEAAMNIVKHGFNGGSDDGMIRLDIDTEEDQLILRLLDNAPSFNGNELRSRSLDDIRPGGLGIYFMRELMDSVEFMPAPAGQGNMVEMRKRMNQNEL